MTNLIYQGKIIRQFWGKLIRQSTVQINLILTKILSYNILYFYKRGGNDNAKK